MRAPYDFAPRDIKITTMNQDKVKNIVGLS